MAGLLIAAVVSGYKARPAEQECHSLRYIIEDREERMYLTEIELTQNLRAKGLYPVDRVVAPTTLHHIEKTIAQHPMVRTAQCYITPRGEMRIRITQKNDYWRARIHHIQVQNPQLVYLHLRGEAMPRVVLGSMRGYEQKLNKLRVFLENGSEATKDKQYREIDLRFKGQVIGRK